MQFVARQEVVAPGALPVSTSRYLQRLRSIVLSRGDKLPRCAAIAAIPPTWERKKSDRNEGEEVRDESVRARYRSLATKVGSRLQCFEERRA